MEKDYVKKALIKLKLAESFSEFFENGITTKDAFFTLRRDELQLLGLNFTDSSRVFQYIQKEKLKEETATQMEGTGSNVNNTKKSSTMKLLSAEYSAPNNSSLSLSPFYLSSSTSSSASSSTTTSSLSPYLLSPQYYEAPVERTQNSLNWDCPRCTLSNAASNQYCEVCNATKPIADGLAPPQIKRARKPRAMEQPEMSNIFRTQLPLPDPETELPLKCAARMGNYEEVCSLIEARADVNVCDSAGMSCLSQAVEKNNIRIVKVLLENKAKINASDRLYFRTPLHEASVSGFFNMAKFLIESKSDVNSTDNQGQTPLYLATWRGWKEICKELVKGGAIVDAKDNASSTPLMRASVKHGAPLADFLLSCGASISIIDRSGKNSLHHACRENAPDVIKLLISKKANINTVDRYRRTPLMYASMEGYELCVALLMQAGADVNLQDNQYQTAEQMAITPRIAALIRHYHVRFAFLMGFHTRLGKESRILGWKADPLFDKHIISMIFEFVEKSAEKT